MFQWPKFQFYNKETLPANGTTQKLQQATITAVSSGNGSVAAGSNTGEVFLLSRDLTVTSLKAFQHSTSAVALSSKRDLLVACGIDDLNDPGILACYATNSTPPRCLRTVRVGSAGCIPCSVDFNHDGTEVAVGFPNGDVVVVRGDLTRDRPPKLFFYPPCQITLPPFQENPNEELNRSVSKVLYQTAQNGSSLFVVSPSMIEVLHPNAPSRVQLDDIGCLPGCCDHCEISGSEMVVGRRDAVYMYTVEGRGGCSAFELTDREKECVATHRGAMIVVCPATDRPNASTVNIYNPKNKHVAFSATFPSVRHISCQWGSVFIFLHDKRIIMLEERDIESKLEMMFKKNRYELALSLARAQGLGPAAITEIITRNADHLYNKEKYDEAMTLYVSTVGRLEPSYVIRKYLDALRIHNLTTYLKALHEHGVATADHTTLLLNCFTKLRDLPDLDAFVKGSQGDTFDVDIAIQVLREGRFFQQALYLARRHRHHDAALRCLIEDLCQFEEAIEYIRTLKLHQAEAFLNRYGKVLVDAKPLETTTLLTLLCTNYNRIGETAEGESSEDDGVDAMTRALTKLDHTAGGSANQANPSDFMHVYADHPKWLVVFLEGVQAAGRSMGHSNLTLMELYLGAEEDVEASQDKVIHLIENDESCDLSAALSLCRQYDFQKGVVLLLNKLKMPAALIEYLMMKNDAEAVLQAAKSLTVSGPLLSNLWLSVLTFLAQREDIHSLVEEAILEIEKRDILPPLEVITCLAAYQHPTLSVVKDYLSRYMSKVRRDCQRNTDMTEQLRAETETMRAEVTTLQTTAKVFQNQKCSLCKDALDLPATHFLCGHHYHQRCLGDDERECLACIFHKKKVVDDRKMLESLPDSHSLFTDCLEGNPPADTNHSAVTSGPKEGGFPTVAHYFGLGIFDKYRDPSIRPNLDSHHHQF